MNALLSPALALLAGFGAGDVLDEALKLRRQGQLERAIALLEPASQAPASPERDEVVGVLGLCLLDAGRREQVDALAATHADAGGESYRLHVFLGRHAQQTGDRARALRLLERAVELKPQPGEALVSLVSVHAAEHDYQKAAMLAEQLEAFEPEQGRLLGARMLTAAADRLVQRVGRRPEAMPRALELYLRAREKAPDDRTLALKLLPALLNTYRTVEAQALIDELFPQETQPVAWNYHGGRCARLAGDLPRCEQQLRRALELEPTHRGATLELARLLLDRADHAEAGALLRAADQRHPDDAEILALRGLLAVARGSFPQAEEYLRRAVAADPSHSEAIYQLGLVLVRNGKREEAQQFLAQIP